MVVPQTEQPCASSLCSVNASLCPAADSLPCWASWHWFWSLSGSRRRISTVFESAGRRPWSNAGSTLMNKSRKSSTNMVSLSDTATTHWRTCWVTAVHLAVFLVFLSMMKPHPILICVSREVRGGYWAWGSAGGAVGWPDWREKRCAGTCTRQWHPWSSCRLVKTQMHFCALVRITLLFSPLTSYSPPCRTPPAGMEAHVPVLFLDLNGEADSSFIKPIFCSVFSGWANTNCLLCHQRIIWQ